MKSLRPLALGFDLAFANCSASQGPNRPPKWRAFGSSLAQNVLGRGMVDFKGYTGGSPWESREVMWECSYGHGCKGGCTIPCFLRAS